jgi:hypothetical protein
MNGEVARGMMTTRIRFMLGAETAIFFLAVLIHLEVLFAGYPDREAALAEAVIGLVLLAGLIFTFLGPGQARVTALIVQGSALAGTFVGLALLVTIGPSTLLDLAIHLVMVVVLVAGLLTTWRARPAFRPSSDRVTDASTRR